VIRCGAFLKPGERVIEHTSVRFLPDPEDRGIGVLYLTDLRLVWHLPSAIANPTGGIPLRLISEAAYADEVLAIRIDVVSGPPTLLFQLYPGPISDGMVEATFAAVDAARAENGQPLLRRSADPNNLL
jgi:hypothetical protein